MGLPNRLVPGNPNNIPACIRKSGASINWNDSLKRKIPIDEYGNPLSYDDQRACKPFSKAVEIAASKDFGIGVTLRSGGLEVTAHGFTGNLICFDFDGFADLETGEPDADLKEILELMGGYQEYSPSLTGAKVYFVTDKQPTKEFQIKFSPSHLSERYPDISKYLHREIEVFSKGRFLALTGDPVFDFEESEIACISAAELDRLIVRLDAIAKRGGGAGLNKPPPKTNLVEPQGSGYGRLTEASLTLVLGAVDPDDESCWSDTANALARVYGEGGRHWFHHYSNRSDKYDRDRVDARFDRALRELGKHPDGVGMRRLIELSQLAGLDSLTLAWEEGVQDCTEPSAESVRDIESLFGDLELRQEDVDAMAEADILYPGMIVRGHVQAYVSPANGGKTTLMVYICEELASKGLQVFYINVDGSPGDLKRHHAHAKQHSYKLIAPDARQGGSAKVVLEKMYQLAGSDQKLDEYIFIFDTLKKFVQVIDKAKAAEFFKLTRSLSVKGATIILLGHTNKHKDDEGNTIFEGTGDLRNDVDELIYLDCFKNEGDGTLEVTTRPDKVRAELEPRTFIIDLKNGRKVTQCGYVKKIIAKEQREVLELFKEAINAGCGSQTELIDFAEPKTRHSRKKLRSMLIEFTRWDVPEIVEEKTGRAKDLKYTLAVGGSL